MEGKELEFDIMSKVMNDALTDFHVQMLIDMPEGTQAVQVEDNLCLGGTAQFFVLLKALTAVWSKLSHIVDPDKMEECVDGILEMVKGELMTVGNGGETE